MIALSWPLFLPPLANPVFGERIRSPRADPLAGSPSSPPTVPPPGPQEIWSWWTNIDAGKQRVAQKDSALTTPWNNRVSDWNDWNNGHPGAEVPPPAPKTEASCTFVWGGSQSFRDACWIKRYNGIPNGDYLIWDNFTDPNHPNWDYRPLNNLGQNYVHQVCSQAP